MNTLDARATASVDAPDTTSEQICAERSLVVAVPPAQVFAVQCDVARWTDWHPDVSHAAPLGPHRPGSVFEWVWRGTATRTRVLEVVEPERLVWSSLSARGASVVTWTFTPTATGTLVAASLRFAPAAPVARSRAQQLQERALERWFEGLVRAVEPDVISLV